MITVELLTSRAGVNWSQNEGDVIELNDKEAKALVLSGQARFVGELVETTAVNHQQHETAARFSRRRNRNGS